MGSWGLGIAVGNPLLQVPAPKDLIRGCKLPAPGWVKSTSSHCKTAVRWASSVFPRACFAGPWTGMFFLENGTLLHCFCATNYRMDHKLCNPDCWHIAGWCFKYVLFFKFRCGRWALSGTHQRAWRAYASLEYFEWFIVSLSLKHPQTQLNDVKF